LVSLCQLAGVRFDQLRKLVNHSPRSRALIWTTFLRVLLGAAVTLLSDVGLVAFRTSAKVSPVAGFGEVKVLPDSASTNDRR